MPRSVLARGLAVAVVAAVLSALNVAQAPMATAASKPTVTSVSPDEGFIAGQTKITIKGTNFSNVKKVTFDGVKGTDLSVKSKTKLKVRVPAGTDLGKVDVVVKTGAGSSKVTSKSKYKYLAMDEVVTSGRHTCRLTAAGELSCWGTNANGQVSQESNTHEPVPVLISGEWAQVSLAERSTCGVKTDHTGYCWGVFTGGAFNQISGEWSLLSASDFVTCGIKTDATLWCWGLNAQGQLGIGSGDSNVVTPTQVGSNTWAEVQVFSSHVCGLTTGGSLFCWGDDSNGVVGNAAAATNSNVPVDLGDGWTALSAGKHLVCGVQDAIGKCWGNNSGGQTGTGTQGSNVEVPTAITGDSDWRDLDYGFNFTCGVKGGGALTCWGQSPSGGMGLDGTTQASSPTTVASGDWLTVEAGSDNSCAIRDDYTLWCWGEAEAGAVGLGSTTDAPTPFQLPGSWWSLSVGENTACAVQIDNTTWCWGRNNYDQESTPDPSGAVGDGTTDHRLEPYPVPAPSS